jgi:hypothetical protein
MDENTIALFKLEAIYVTLDYYESHLSHHKQQHFGRLHFMYIPSYTSMKFKVCFTPWKSITSKEGILEEKNSSLSHKSITPICSYLNHVGNTLKIVRTTHSLPHYCIGWLQIWCVNHVITRVLVSEMVGCGWTKVTSKYLKAKEELWKFKYFTTQKYNLQKNPLEETKIFQDIITL